MALQILFPNGQVMAVNLYIGDPPVLWDGTVVSSGGGPILDGVSAAIKATVRDFSTSNPVAVALTDATGNHLATLPVSSGAVAVAATVTSVNDLDTNQTLLALNASRKGYKLFNDSSAVAYVKEGTTATTADYSYQILPGGYYESVGAGVYTGRIDCIWASNASGAMKITELA